MASDNNALWKPYAKKACSIQKCDVGWEIEATSQIKKFPTIRAKFGAKIDGKFYYEAVLQTDGLMQLGFCTSKIYPDINKEYGVGDDEYGWAFDGKRLKKWHDLRDKKYGNKVWSVGDVIGVGLNLDKSIIEFWHNGEHLGVAFDYISSWEKIYPCITLSCPNKVTIICDKKHFKQKIPKGYQAFEFEDNNNNSDEKKDNDNDINSNTLNESDLLEINDSDEIGDMIFKDIKKHKLSTSDLDNLLGIVSKLSAKEDNEIDLNYILNKKLYGKREEIRLLEYVSEINDIGFVEVLLKYNVCGIRNLFYLTFLCVRKTCARMAKTNAIIGMF